MGEKEPFDDPSVSHAKCSACLEEERKSHPATQKSLLGYILKVVLEGSSPSIWRRIQVRGNTKLDVLHMILQSAMGWGDKHSHEFIIDKKKYANPSHELEKTLDEAEYVLNNLIKTEGESFKYVYDFGDDWVHEITVEKIETKDTKLPYPVCLEGKGACPPEDIGGIPGYEERLLALKDPSHPEHKEIADWFEPSFDPEAFNIEMVNKDLKALKELYSK
jgi:hypothetical protein